MISKKDLNIWSNIHVDDLANFYVLLLEKALKGEADTGKDGFYFCENGQHVWRDVVSRITEELYKNKAIKSDKVTEFTTEEIDSLFGKFAWSAIGCNSRSRAERAKDFGWTPNEEIPSVFDSIEAEVKAILLLEKENLSN